MVHERQTIKSCRRDYTANYITTGIVVPMLLTKRAPLWKSLINLEELRKQTFLGIYAIISCIIFKSLDVVCRRKINLAGFVYVVYAIK